MEEHISGIVGSLQCILVFKASAEACDSLGVPLLLSQAMAHVCVRVCESDDNVDKVLLERAFKRAGLGKE